MSRTWIFAAAAIVLLAIGACSRSSEPGKAKQDHAGHASSGTAQGQTGPAASAGAGPRSPAGYATVTIHAEREQLFGVRTERAARGMLAAELRTVGIVRTDETRESHVHVKWSGWIEEFQVSYVGQRVSKGDPLFAVYSPDLVTAQLELVLARRRADGAKTDGRGGEAEAAAALLDAARDKLRLWDVPSKTIEDVETSGEVQRLITVDAPRDGTVIERMALPGMYVEPSMGLYTIADLSRVWVLADVYENEIGRVELGQQATFEPVGSSGSIEARVAFIDPTVSAMTRTVKVRLEVDNADGHLRPGAYGTLRLKLAGIEGLLVPSDAVIETGEHNLVFVRTAPGRFEPRHVSLGARDLEHVQVLEGVVEGEEVVTRAQFLLDSESRLRAVSGAGAAPAHGGH